MVHRACAPLARQLCAGGSDLIQLRAKNTPVTEVRRLAGLGARFVRHNLDPDDDYVVMTDPEGNEFCVCVKADL